MQHVPPKHWYPITTLSSVTIQNNSTKIFTAVKTSNLASVTAQTAMH